jgi:hypothetical protein
MPFGIRKKEVPVFKTDITKEEELNEIHKVANRLDPDEKVLLVAKQSRVRPGGSIITTPNIIFATDKRLLIRNPTMLGMRENIEDIPYSSITGVKLEKGIFSSTIVLRSPGLSEMGRVGRSTGLIAWGRGEDGAIDAIPKDKADQLMQIIKNGVEASKKPSQQFEATVVNQQFSVADELAKLTKLKEQGVLSDEEFQQMKQELMKKM